MCRKVTFAEQIDGLTVRYQRRTPLLQRALVQIAGVLLASRGGARLLHLLHAGLSRTGVLSHLMRIPLPTPVALRVLGVLRGARARVGGPGRGSPGWPVRRVDLPVHDVAAGP